MRSYKKWNREILKSLLINKMLVNKILKLVMNIHENLRNKSKND